MKLYAYENCEGDKGIIVANSWEEAVEIFQKEYPERILGGNTIDEYWIQNEKGESIGAMMEKVDYIENGKLYCTFPY